jgi:outer membrane protein TolC
MACLKLAIAIAACAAAGCQSYTPRPLDDESHMLQWQSRRVDSDEIKAFAESLAQAGDVTSLDVADGVSLGEAHVVALAYNADLRDARARAAVALAGAEYAGLWDDPVLDVDVLHILESVPNPWVIGAAVGFTVPLSGRLDVEKSLARAEHELALREVIEREWAIAADLRRSWLAWSVAHLQAELNTQLLQRIEAMIQIVERLEEAGALTRLESRLFRLERASRETDRIRFEAEAARLEVEIKSLMGLLPDAPVTLLPTVVLGENWRPSEGVERRETLLRNPALASSRAAYDAAEHALHLEVRRQYPDITLGPAVERDEDQSKIGFIFGLPIPILNANRRGIAEAGARRDHERIAYERKLEQLVSALSAAEIQWRAAKRVREQIEQIAIPLIEEQLAEHQQLADMGQLDTLLTLETLIRAQEAKSQLVEARLDEALALNRIGELIGPAGLDRTTIDGAVR